MTFLFGSNMSFRKKLKVIAKLAAEHASNLAAFACLYKVSKLLESYILNACKRCKSAGGCDLCRFCLFLSIILYSHACLFLLFISFILTDDVGYTQSIKQENTIGLQ